MERFTALLFVTDMEIITSSDNKLIKRLVKLKQKKYREIEREFYIEGYKNVLDTYTAAISSVKEVILSESAYKKYGGAFERFTVISDALFTKISDTDCAQGVISINRAPEFAFPDTDRIIYLDRVRDPGNVGTILRTACAAGYGAVLSNCADILSPKVTRSSMSAILKCKIGLDIGIGELSSRGYEVISSDMGGENVFTSDKPSGKYCVVIGNEADGIDREIIKSSDRVLSIPQEGIESLNAAVAAAIMMYALRY
ncbi:MAG: RNA methyltransferase [Clostridiales bacterium]|nr:RNA methyltransferase [Clostridiales bacterium]